MSELTNAFNSLSTCNMPSKYLCEEKIWCFKWLNLRAVNLTNEIFGHTLVWWLSLFFKQISNDQFLLLFWESSVQTPGPHVRVDVMKGKKSKSSDTSSLVDIFRTMVSIFAFNLYAAAINDATLTCRMSRELTTNGSSNGSGRYCILHTVVMSHRFDRKNNWILIYWPCLFVEEGIAQ